MGKYIQLKISPYSNHAKYIDNGINMIYAPKVNPKKHDTEAFLDMCKLCLSPVPGADTKEGQMVRSFFIPELAIPRSRQIYDSLVTKYGNLPTRLESLDSIIVESAARVVEERPTT